MSAAALPVLVVEDEPSLRRLLRTSLSARGYRVLEAGTGDGAIASLARDAPEVVLLDLGLPDMDGLEVIRRVRAGGTRTPIIVLSSRGDERGKVQALDLEHVQPSPIQEGFSIEAKHASPPSRSGRRKTWRGLTARICGIA
jgi:two-component system, OmpR family, KDP operon response regulator KdpE